MLEVVLPVKLILASVVLLVQEVNDLRLEKDCLIFLNVMRPVRYQNFSLIRISNLYFQYMARKNLF